MSYKNIKSNECSKDELFALEQEIFYDTLKLCNENKLLNESIKDSLKRSRVYKKPDFESFESIRFKNLDNNVTLSNYRTLNAARFFSLKGLKTAVLNFANGVNPGGGVDCGCLTQEESICRSSTLFNVIDDYKFKKEFYDYHARHDSLLSSSRLIYTPDVIVFKTDETLPEVMNKKDWYKVDVITQAAPINLEDSLKPHKMYQIFYERISAIFKAAILEDVDVLVLGAYGCGAFNNNPYVVAEAFKDVITAYHMYFKHIHFAIIKGNDDNYEAFKEVLSSR